MPTAKVTKNVSAATGGGNVLCSTLISIKTKAWLYSFYPKQQINIQWLYSFRQLYFYDWRAFVTFAA